MQEQSLHAASMRRAERGVAVSGGRGHGEGVYFNPAAAEAQKATAARSRAGPQPDLVTAHAAERRTVGGEALVRKLGDGASAPRDIRHVWTLGRAGGRHLRES